MPRVHWYNGEKTNKGHPSRWHEERRLSCHVIIPGEQIIDWTLTSFISGFFFNKSNWQAIVQGTVQVWYVKVQSTLQSSQIIFQGALQAWQVVVQGTLQSWHVILQVTLQSWHVIFWGTLQSWHVIFWDILQSWLYASVY